MIQQDMIIKIFDSIASCDKHWDRFTSLFKANKDIVEHKDCYPLHLESSYNDSIYSPFSILSDYHNRHIIKIMETTAFFKSCHIDDFESFIKEMRGDEHFDEDIWLVDFDRFGEKLDKRGGELLHQSFDRCDHKYEDDLDDPKRFLVKGKHYQETIEVLQSNVFLLDGQNIVYVQAFVKDWYLDLFSENFINTDMEQYHYKRYLIDIINQHASTPNLFQWWRKVGL